MIATTGAVVREALSVAHTVVAAGVVGVYGVATLPDHRRRGYGEALSWAATLTAPHLPAVLAPSEMAEAIYHRMGYREIGRSTRWLRVPS